MKKNIFIILLVSLTLLSCTKILDTTPQDFVSPINSYKTERELESALAGIYDRMGDQRVYAQAMTSYMVFSDEFFMKGRTTGIEANIVDAATLELNRHWEALYTGIDRANMLLDNMSTDHVSEDKFNEIRGQALFLRSYYYFLLVDQFGSIPLKLSSTKSPDEVPLPGAPIKTIYDQILKDMKEAEKLVRPITDYGYNTRVSKTVVQGIIARVCLKMAGYPLYDTHKYEDAKNYADSVITSGLHNLNPDFKQIFINHSGEVFDNQYRECLWEVEFKGKNQGEILEAGMIGSYNGIQSPSTTAGIEVGFGTDFVHATAKLYNAYRVGDLRRDWTVAPFRYTASGTTVVKTNWGANEIYERSNGKWRREYETNLPRVQYFNGTNWPLLRYADVLLIFAEADNNLPNSTGPSLDAEKALNQVRRRAYGKDINQEDLTVDVPKGMGKQEFQDSIRNERLRELAFEGLRKHDLIRWGIYELTMREQAGTYRSSMPSSLNAPAIAQAERITERAVLFPIPNSELSVNFNMKQNSGW